MKGEAFIDPSDAFDHRVALLKRLKAMRPLSLTLKNMNVSVVDFSNKFDRGEFQWRELTLTEHKPPNSHRGATDVTRRLRFRPVFDTLYVEWLSYGEWKLLQEFRFEGFDLKKEDLVDVVMGLRVEDVVST